jgi:transmembrane sensor
MQKFPDHIAIDFIPAYLAGKATAEQVAILEEWINASSENKAYFESLKRTWEESGKLEPKPVMVDVDKAWGKLNARIEAGDTKVISIGKRKRITTMGILLRIAAVLIPILFLAWLYFWQSGKNRQMELITSVSVLQDTLPDGTLITLNSGSKLNYPEKFKGSKREVSLEGEAYFDVTPDKEKPFIIHSGDANIRVLGTSFNVNAYENKDEVEVFVKEGRVLLYGYDKSSGDTNSVVLAAGEKGFFNKLTQDTGRKSERAFLENQNPYLQQDRIVDGG